MLQLASVYAALHLRVSALAVSVEEDNDLRPTEGVYISECSHILSHCTAHCFWMVTYVQTYVRCIFIRKSLREIVLGSFTSQDVLHYDVNCKETNSPTLRYTKYLNLTYILTYGAEPFLKSRQLCSPSRTSQHFTEPEGLIPCSQEPSTEPVQVRGLFRIFVTNLFFTVRSC
jgi:hypothetical protein